MNDNPGIEPDETIPTARRARNPFKGTPFEQLFGGGMPDLGALFGGAGAAGAAPAGCPTSTRSSPRSSR